MVVVVGGGGGCDCGAGLTGCWGASAKRLKSCERGSISFQPCIIHIMVYDISTKKVIELSSLVDRGEGPGTTA